MSQLSITIATVCAMLFVVIFTFFLLPIFMKSVVIEGKVIRKKIASNEDEDSYITVETLTKEDVVLRFARDSHWGVRKYDQSWFSSLTAQDLHETISLQDKIKVKTYDKAGSMRNAHMILAITKAAANDPKEATIMETETDNGLFTGKIKPLGGIENEKELLKNCPDKFKEKNPWSEFANWTFYNGTQRPTMNWKITDEEERRNKMKYFWAVMRGVQLEIGEKAAIAGWMLSEMLVEIPTYVSQKKP